jgi:hypothetical protein
MPLQQSVLISRRQLSALSGGKAEGCHFPLNPLGLSTPVSHTGGAAFAAKDGLVSHIAVKENMNLPLPEEAGQELFILRAGSDIKWDMEILRKKDPRQGAVPVFWEPDNQPDKATRVVYIGHWKVTGVELDHTKWKAAEALNLNGKFRQELKAKTFLGILRCAEVTLQPSRYDTDFARVIATAAPETCAKIGTLSFDGERENDEGDAVMIGMPVKTEAMEDATTGVPIKTEVMEATEDDDDDSVISMWSGNNDTEVAARRKRARRENERAPPQVVSSAAVARRKRSRHENENERAPPQVVSRAAVATAAVATASVARDNVAPPSHKDLNNCNADEVSRLAASKGEAFLSLAKNIKRSDFQGAFLVRRLRQGDAHFLHFLEHACGMQDELCRLSVMDSFKQASNFF